MVIRPTILLGLLAALGSSAALGPVGLSSEAHARSVPLSMRMAPESDKPPEVLYEEGVKAYRLSRFGEAVEKWEKAYDLSERALLLYNIALAYKGLYGISGDLEDLRKARAVMNNFLIIAQSDPDVQADDAAERLAEIDAMIVEAEASQGEEPDPDPDPPVIIEPRPMLPDGPDPGKKLRIAGAATLGAGGLLLVTGAVLGIYFGVRGQEFSDELRQLQAERSDLCLDPASQDCLEQDAAIDNARSNGRAANLGLGLSMGVGGGLGVVALGAGAILFVQGNRKTAEWKKTGFAAHLRLVPTGRGLALHGRF
ncbi:MAG: hypothetical protein KC501_39560 [Myxococcales bacterium]|nr:hypothetical protein [Myxococcales bacterium]